MNEENHCYDCGAVFVPSQHIPGYAVRPNGQKICYVCADIEQREMIKDTSSPFVGYVSSDGKRITTWTGGTLMYVMMATVVKLTRWSFTHGKTINHYRCIDIHGKRWYGKSSPGIAIKLRAVKNRA